MLKHILTIITVCLGLLLSNPATAQLPISPDVPLVITADSLKYNPDGRMVVFSGNVEVQRENFRIWSDLLTLYLKGGRGAPSQASANDSAATPEGVPALGPGDLDKIIAEKNVKFQFNTQSGTASKATYTLDSGILLLEGRPTLRDGENSISGSSIRYYLNENRSEVEGGPSGRVEAVFGGKQ